MARQHRFSLFAQRLDRVAFAAYFLGAVIPLAALVYLTQRYLEVADLATGAGASLFRSRLFLIALIVSIAVLSLGSFLALRRTVRQALERVERDNQRLARLVRSSRTLAAAAHRSDVYRVAVDSTAALTGARAAYCVAPGAEGRLAPNQFVGQQAEEVYAAYREALDGIAGRALETRRPAVAGLDELVNPGRAVPEPHQITAAIAVPCGAETCLAAVFRQTPGGGKAVDADVLSTLSGLASAALRNVELQAAQRNFFTHVTHLLTGALDSHLGFHTEHSVNVAHLSVQLGRELGFDTERLEKLHFAALLHDIGMLKFDPELFADRRAIRQHPEIGAEMLERIALWEDLAPLVRHHHEWFDGGGYPEGLEGEHIPLESRIIGLAEAFESMTSSASYKTPVDVPRALERIEESAGTQFDPELARTFVDLAREDRLSLDRG